MSFGSKERFKTRFTDLFKDIKNQTVDFDETVKVLFMQNGSVMRKNMTRPNQYLIYHKD